MTPLLRELFTYARFRKGQNTSKAERAFLARIARALLRLRRIERQSRPDTQ